MPHIKPLSDFTRNQNAVIDELATTREPIYLTRNGHASVVMMDAQAFDDLVSRQNELREREMRTYENLMRGYQDVIDGAVVSADEAAARIRAAKGW